MPCIFRLGRTPVLRISSICCLSLRSTSSSNPGPLSLTVTYHFPSSVLHSTDTRQGGAWVVTERMAFSTSSCVHSLGI